MNIKHVKLAFSLLFLGIIPIMSMNNQNAPQWLGIPLPKQKKFFNDFNDIDINKIAEIDINKGILLENHLKDLREIESYSPLKRNAATGLILGHNFDREQKLMRLIECASFISSSALSDLIKYGLDHNLIPQEMLDGSDNTVDSFYKIKNIFDAKPQQTLQLVKKVLPQPIENITEYPLDENFDAITNDIKTIKYKNDEKELDKITDLSSFEPFFGQNNQGFNVLKITTNSKKLEQRESTTKSIKELFNSTSLPHKLALVIRLNDLNKHVSKNINTIKMVQANDFTRYQIFADAYVSNLFILGFFILMYQLESHKMTQPLLTKLITTLDNKDYHESIYKAALKEFWDSRALITPGLTASKALYTICCNKNFKLFGTLMTALGTGFYYHRGHSLARACETSFLFFGSMTGLAPLPQLYFLYKYFFTQFTHDKELGEMKKEQKNIQNLIEEFKDSIKEEYKN